MTKETKSTAINEVISHLAKRNSTIFCMRDIKQELPHIKPSTVTTVITNRLINKNLVQIFDKKFPRKYKYIGHRYVPAMPTPTHIPESLGAKVDNEINKRNETINRLKSINTLLNTRVNKLEEEVYTAASTINRLQLRIKHLNRKLNILE